MASRSVNKVILIGNLGRDAETRFTPSGSARTTFSIATSRRWKDQQTGEWREETDWHNIVMWRQENIANYLTKGQRVFVEGRLQTRSYDDRDGNKRYMTEVVVGDLLLLGRGGGGEVPEESRGEPVSAPRSQPEQSPDKPAESSPFDAGVSDDDVPF
ncbi:MAG: single-stranded DNA-binding protein [bacterium]|nr:single-stranded DNA-binding protein [bacterium]